MKIVNDCYYRSLIIWWGRVGRLKLKTNSPLGLLFLLSLNIAINWWLSTLLTRTALFVERQEERLKTNNRDLSMVSVMFKC